MSNILYVLRDRVRQAFENWDIKGLIDSKKNIYIVSQDTKLLSKVFELYITPIIYDFAKEYSLEVLPAPAQNKYPDFSLRGEALNSGDKWVALDIKSGYRDGNRTKFTLGTYRGYMRDQESTQYSTLPYKSYMSHWCLCIIYTRAEGITEERKYTLEEIDKIPTICSDFEVHLHEKYKLASYTPGSGNTANIGSVTSLDDIRNGTGPFAQYGVEVFEDYWINYMRKEDAERLGLKEPPYHDLDSYFEWRKNNPKT